jgi:hypothetical protein
MCFGGILILQFTAYATEIADLSHQEAPDMMQVIEALSDLITSASLASGSTFPRNQQQQAFQSFATILHSLD